MNNENLNLTDAERLAATAIDHPDDDWKLTDAEIEISRRVAAAVEKAQEELDKYSEDDDDNRSRALQCFVDDISEYDISDRCCGEHDDLVDLDNNVLVTVDLFGLDDGIFQLSFCVEDEHEEGMVSLDEALRIALDPEDFIRNWCASRPVRQFQGHVSVGEKMMDFPG